MESLTYEHDPAGNNFARREAFIRLWCTSHFDLHFFSAARGRDMAKVIKHFDHILKEKGDKIPQHDNFIQAVRKGMIEGDIFEKYGPAMALQWVVRMEDVARVRQKQTDAAKKSRQARLDQKNAERVTRSSCC
jgi:hypothetical protein